MVANTSHVDPYLAHLPIIPLYNTGLRETKVEKLVRTDLYHVYHLDWIIVIFGCMVYNGRRYVSSLHQGSYRYLTNAGLKIFQVTRYEFRTQ